jgi:hypothetical protein
MPGSLLGLGRLLEDRDVPADAASLPELATTVADEVWAFAAGDAQRIAVAITRMAGFTGLGGSRCAGPGRSSRTRRPPLTLASQPGHARPLVPRRAGR